MDFSVMCQLQYVIVRFQTSSSLFISLEGKHQAVEIVKKKGVPDCIWREKVGNDLFVTELPSSDQVQDSELGAAWGGGAGGASEESLLISTDVYWLSDGPDIAEDILVTPGLGLCRSHPSLIIVDSVAQHLDFCWRGRRPVRGRMSFWRGGDGANGRCYQEIGKNESWTRLLEFLMMSN